MPFKTRSIFELDLMWKPKIVDDVRVTERFVALEITWHPYQLSKMAWKFIEKYVELADAYAFDFEEIGEKTRTILKIVDDVVPQEGERSQRIKAIAEGELTGDYAHQIVWEEFQRKFLNSGDPDKYDESHFMRDFAPDFISWYKTCVVISKLKESGRYITQ